MEAYQCQNKDDIKTYLRNSLRDMELPDEPNEASKYKVTYQGKTWMPRKCFKRAFHWHAAYQEMGTDRWSFHVFEVPEDDWKGGDQGPNHGVYQSYDEMIDKVAAIYAKAWKLE